MKEALLKPWLILTTLLLAGVALALSITNTIQSKKDRVVFINNALVYEEFRGKQVLEQRLQKNVEGQKSFLDSLQLSLSTMDPETDKDYVSKVELFNNVNQNYQLNLGSQREEFINQALNQINMHVEEYARSRGYDYIIGNTGQGNIVFAKERVDKTKEVIEYVNQAYEKSL